jgi:hypothetical protein
MNWPFCGQRFKPPERKNEEEGVEQAYQEAVHGVSVQWTSNDARITGL